MTTGGSMAQAVVVFFSSVKSLYVEQSDHKRRINFTTTYLEVLRKKNKYIIC